MPSLNGKNTLRTLENSSREQRFLSLKNFFYAVHFSVRDGDYLEWISCRAKLPRCVSRRSPVTSVTRLKKKTRNINSKEMQ